MNTCSIVSLFAVIFVYIVLAAGTVFAQDDVRSNMELLQLVIEQSVERLSDELPAGSPIFVSVEGTEFGWFFRHRTIEMLTAKGYSVSGERNEADENYYTVEMGIERFGMQYSDVKRRSLFGPRTFTRQADGDFSFRITGGNRERVIRVSEYVSDVIPYGKRNEIENDAFPFTRADLPDGSMIERFLGPAVIVAATGMVVYLFFSVRS